MAAGKFIFLSKAINDLIYSQAAFTSTATIRFKLSTAAFDATKTGATIAEASYTSYAPVSEPPLRARPLVRLLHRRRRCLHFPARGICGAPGLSGRSVLRARTRR